MEITSDELKWTLFEKCMNFNEKNLENPNTVSWYHCEWERRCDNGKTQYPIRTLTKTKTGKEKLNTKWLKEECPKCKGTGFIPTQFARNLAVALRTVLKYDDWNAAIDSNEIPYDFQPKETGYY